MTGEAGFEIHDDGGTLFTLTADEAPRFLRIMDEAHEIEPLSESLMALRSQLEPFRDRSDLCRVQFIGGRTRFIAHDDDGIKPNERPPFGCCLVMWQKPDDRAGEQESDQ